MTYPGLKDVSYNEEKCTKNDIILVSFSTTDTVFSRHSLPRNSVFWDVRIDTGSAGLELYDKSTSCRENAVLYSNHPSGLSHKCLALFKLLFREYCTLKNKMVMIVYVRNPVASITLRYVLY